jgi:type I restriction enzyme S subunit
MIKNKWQTKKLGDVCKTSSGGTPLKSHKEYYENGSIPWILSGEVSQGEIYNSRHFITDEGLKNSSAKLFPQETVLVAMYGATAGQVGILKFPATTNQAVCGIFPTQILLPKFIYYFFLSIKDDLLKQAVGGAQPNISQLKIREQQIPIPPIEIQERIIIMLDRTDSLRQKRRESIQLFDKYLTSVFVEMFGEPDKNHHKYEEVRLKDVSVKITDGEHTTPKRTDSGIKLLSARNVKNGYIDFEAGVDYIPTEEYERIIKRCNPEFGDLLISCSGTIGRVTAVNITEPFTLVRSAALIKPDKEKIDVKYLEYYLQSAYMQYLMFRSVNQSSQANLFLGQINKLPILVPPLNLQKEFTRLVDKQNHAKKKMIEQKGELDLQFEALMHETFKY